MLKVPKNLSYKDRFQVQYLIPDGWVLFRQKGKKSLEGWLTFYTKAIWKKRAIDVTDFEYPYDKGVMALLLQSVFGITMDIEGDFYQFNKWGDVRKVSNLKGLLRNYFSFLHHRAKIENSRFMMEYFNLYFYNSHKVVLDQPEYQKFIPWSDDEFGDIFEVSGHENHVIRSRISFNRNNYRIVVTDEVYEDRSIDYKKWDVIASLTKTACLENDGFVSCREVVSSLNPLIEHTLKECSDPDYNKNKGVSSRKIMSYFDEVVKLNGFTSTPCQRKVNGVNSKGRVITRRPELEVVSHNVVSQGSVYENL